LVETSSAIIEKNEISDNIKANIALGGSNSVNTIIVENKIMGSRCEGIFTIETGNCWILRNSIMDNNDGIVCLTSIPDIIKNNISRNKSNGIFYFKFYIKL
jgi:F-box protein 11